MGDLDALTSLAAAQRLATEWQLKNDALRAENERLRAALRSIHTNDDPLHQALNPKCQACAAIDGAKPRAHP